MKNIMAVIIILISSICYAQVKMDKGWNDIFRTDEKTKQFIKEMQKTFDNDSTKRNFREYFIWEMIETQVNSQSIDKANPKFSLEFLRINGKKDEILLRQYKYPLPDIKQELTKNDFIKDINVKLFAGLFAIPITQFDLPVNILEKFDQEQKESEVLYGLLILPLKKQGNVYTLNLTLVTDIKLFGEIAHTCNVGMNIKMSVGERIKIAIGPGQFLVRPGLNYVSTVNDSSKYATRGIAFPTGSHVESINSDAEDNWTIWSVIDGQKVKFSSNDDYFKDKQDYLILSLETDCNNAFPDNNKKNEPDKIKHDINSPLYQSTQTEYLRYIMSLKSVKITEADLIKTKNGDKK